MLKVQYLVIFVCPEGLDIKKKCVSYHSVAVENHHVKLLIESAQHVLCDKDQEIKRIVDGIFIFFILVDSPDS